jgi:hypothetical protein
MKSNLKRLLALLVILCAWLVVSRWVEKRQPHARDAPSAHGAPQPPAPKLLRIREATPDAPIQSWERLLVEDGTPAEDRTALQDIVSNYLQSAPHSTRPPLGTNGEITRALMDRDALGESAIPASHPAIVSGELVDRWGSPWFFHQVSADLIEVRSAGADRKLFTEDDLK